MLQTVFNDREMPSRQDEWSRTATMVQNTSNTLMVRRLVFKESFGYIALLPLRIFLEGQDDDPRYFDGKLNPFLPLFILAALVPLQCRRATFRRALDLVCLCIGIHDHDLFLAPIRIRYLLPILPASGCPFSFWNS